MKLSDLQISKSNKAFQLLKTFLLKGLDFFYFTKKILNFYLHEKKLLKNVFCYGNESAIKHAEKVAFYVTYHPMSHVSIPPDRLRVCRALRKSGYLVVYIHNGLIESSDRDIALKYVDLLIERENIGQDFGAYKVAFEILLKWHNPSLFVRQKVIFMNDSCVCISEAGLASFVQNLENYLENNDLDVLAPFMTFRDHIHLQSFMFMLGSRVFHSKKYRQFWLNYKPASGRRYAIHMGEVRHTNAIKKSGLKMSSYYQNVCSHIESPYELIEYAPRGAADQYQEKYREIKGLYYDYLQQVCDLSVLHNIHPEKYERIVSFLEKELTFRIVESYECMNSAHAFNLLLAARAAFPLLKKDLVHRGVVSSTQIFSFLESCSSQSLDEETISDVVTEICSRASLPLMGNYLTRKLQQNGFD